MLARRLQGCEAKWPEWSHSGCLKTEVVAKPDLRNAARHATPFELVPNRLDGLGTEQINWTNMEKKNIKWV